MASLMTAPVQLRTCTGVRSAAVPARSVRLVVRAEAQRTQSPVQAVQDALRKAEVPSWARPAAVTALANALMALPAHAEAGKIFDFNATLPLMAGQFLLLMVFLDKSWFTPVGALLEERDLELRTKLGKFKDNNGELQKLQDEAESELTAARKAAQALIMVAKDATNAEQSKVLAEAKAKLDKELESALAVLESERNEALKNLDAQVGKLSAEILARVLPEGVKL